jgi:hypothetical protein
MNKLFIILSLCALVACERAPSSYEFTKEDEALLDSIQRQTLNYFTVFAEPNTGLARERDRHQEGNIVTTGGTGFGIMAIIAGAERGFLPKEEATERISKIANSLDKMERFHGAWAHWYDGDTGEPFSFSKYDDGGDLVETALLMQGVLTARQWTDDQELKELCDKLWKGVEWDWYTRGTDTLYWHWSKNHEWKMNHAIRGFDETLITYVLAASSPTHTISRHCYEASYKTSDYYYNGREYYGIPLSIGMEKYGGPLFFTHYSFLGLNPTGLHDGYTDYFERNRNQCLIQIEYAKEKGMPEDWWGFTSSDDALVGYSGHYPGTPEENGTVSPTAAISSIVYTPEQSLRVIRKLLEDPRTWGPCGFYDAVNYTLPEELQVVQHYLAIDQGPQIVMIENARSGLLWELFMSAPEINAGLEKLGFYYTDSK